MRYGVAGFGCLCAVLWVLLGFGVLEGHSSSVSGVFVRDWEPLFLLSRAGIFCGFVCGGVCLGEYDTPKTAIFSDLDYFSVNYLFN